MYFGGIPVSRLKYRQNNSSVNTAIWLCTNTLEYIGIWEQVYNPDFNYGEFAIIKNQAGLNRFKISVKEFQRLKEEEQKALRCSA